MAGNAVFLKGSWAWDLGETPFSTLVFLSMMMSFMAEKAICMVCMDFCWISIEASKQIREFLLVGNGELFGKSFSNGLFPSSSPHTNRSKCAEIVCKATHFLGILGFGERYFKRVGKLMMMVMMGNGWHFPFSPHMVEKERGFV